MDSSINRYQICLCLHCGIRYPVANEDKFATLCPQCRSKVQVVSNFQVQPNKLISYKEQHRAHLKLEGLLDNVRSAWNVGSMLRTADGIGIHHMYLCGITPTPDNPKVSKTSLGSESTVSWSYHPNALKAVIQIKEQGYRLWGLEGEQHAVPLNEIYHDLNGTPIVLIVGNENFGIDPEILDQCQRLIYIPMGGVKHSYNVAVAFGIASYYLLSLYQSSKSSPKDQ
jgi:23S rRNA (guanosine2251-2'-O)-methyltransferase